MTRRSPSKTRELFSKEIEPDPFVFERACFQSGYRYIAGIDEAGRGPLAGPVVAAAVILPRGCRIPKLTDSKKLTPKQRDDLFPVIQEKAASLGVGISDAALIDRINILEATRRAMEQAVHALDRPPDYLLIDALWIHSAIPQQSIIKGDLLSHSVAAASVIAKVTRDRMMEEYHRLYPDYNFKQNRGYGTLEHCNKVRDIGPSPIHRKTFRRVREHCL